MLVHQLQHALVGGLHAVVERAAAGLRGHLHVLFVQRFLEPDQRRPLDADLLVHQQARHLLEERGRIGLVGEQEMLAAVFLLERLDLLDDLAGRHPAILVEIALPMVAEGAAAPVAAARGEIRKDAHRHEIAVERKAVEIRQRQRRRLFGIDLRVDVDARGIAVHEIGHRRLVPLAGQRLEQPQQRVLALVHDGRVEHLPEESLVLRQLLLQPRDDVAADHDVNLREGFLDHLAEGQTGHELHLRAD